MEPKDKVIVVTGASGGIGLASARALASAGAQVVLAARSTEKLAEEAARIGDRAMAVTMDVTDDASVTAAVERVLARFGRIDALINNAGTGGNLGYWAESAPSAVREMFDVHVFGMERVTRAVLPSMLARGEGTIVNVASTVAWVPMPMAAAYSSAKAAVVSFSHSLRGELAHLGIQVMVFGPPHTRTKAGDAWPLEGPSIYEPEWVAEELVRALRRGRKSFLAGASNRALLAIQRISPDYALFIMKRIGLRAGSKALLASAK